MSRICVFAGSNPGVRPEFVQAARELGQELANRGIGLVYGGGRLGLMGAIADATLAADGEVIGVMPRGLFQREVAHEYLTKLYTVNSMHERKALMADLADAFIALPGGFGTFDELFEITTWAQIGIHTKPIGLLDVAQFFLPLLALIEHASQEGFINPFHTQLLLHYQTPAALLDALASYTPPPLQSKWTELPPQR
ncbi:LOG family protein [Dictyobacter formicarum]|uniref:Cytokinin riboside 5'-monophosphate phosphoribohydrolase n=1 Tax=Dictyobacter formicarum TaxID=2778368 RepID=A0ABQ3VBI4_9CHLR|nr:TIGR00730 family Rossman fold protein [Dictyobacter formicarum]GHO83257.1 cytokinin riboside 5'-monophosphate phosphoribohydrolase [Dictyobacter formicarum]